MCDSLDEGLTLSSDVSDPDAGPAYRSLCSRCTSCVYNTSASAALSASIGNASQLSHEFVNWDTIRGSNTIHGEGATS